MIALVLIPLVVIALVLIALVLIALVMIALVMVALDQVRACIAKKLAPAPKKAQIYLPDLPLFAPLLMIH